MQEDPTIANYLRDLGSLLRDMALEAKRHYEAGRGSDADQFLLGRLGALHEVLSLMQQQSTAFGIPQSAVSLEGFDPDNELL